MASQTPISIGARFDSYDLYGLTGGSTPSGASIYLDLDPAALGFTPPENGILQWLNPVSETWTNVDPNSGTQPEIKVAADGAGDLRFIPTAEAARLSGDIDLTIATADVSTSSSFSSYVTIPLTINDGAAFSYASGQAIGINGVNADVGANLDVRVPVLGAMGVSSSGVSDNAVALAEGTSFGGVLGNPTVHGDPDPTDVLFRSGADLSVLADVKTKITADASTSADSASDYADADAHTRVGIKLPPDASGYVNPVQGGFGVLNMDMLAGGGATVRGTTDIGAQTTTDSTSGRARSITEVGAVAGVGDTAIEAAADLSLTGIAGATLRTDARSAMGSAESMTSLDSLRGVFSDATETVGGVVLNNPGRTGDAPAPYQTGADLSIATGVNLVAHTSASVVGDGVGDAFESPAQYQKGDSATAIAELGNAFGLASNAEGGLLMEADGRVDLAITSMATILTEAEAVSGHTTAISEILSNNGAVNAVLEAGDSGSIKASSTTLFETTANTIVGDSLASGTALDTVAIGASMFDFTGLGGIVDANALTSGRVKAVSTKGEASASINSSTGGIQASTSNDASWLDDPFPGAGSFTATMDGAERIAAITTNQGFALAAAVAGDGTHNGVTATAIQSALGVDGYTFNTSESMHLTSETLLDSTAHAVFGTTSV
jgi:hypothetical protein